MDLFFTIHRRWMDIVHNERYYFSTIAFDLHNSLLQNIAFNCELKRPPLVPLRCTQNFNRV